MDDDELIAALEREGLRPLKYVLEKTNQQIETINGNWRDWRGYAERLTELRRVKGFIADALLEHVKD